MKNLDDIEKEYLYYIKYATEREESDTAYDLSIGLKEYRKYYKVSYD